MNRVYVITVTRKNCGTDANVFRKLRPAVDYLNWTLKVCKVFDDPAERKATMRRILEDAHEGGWSYGQILDPEKLEHPYDVAEWSIGTQRVL
jgi:hypothetical protein